MRSHLVLGGGVVAAALAAVALFAGLTPGAGTTGTDPHHDVADERDLPGYVGGAEVIAHGDLRIPLPAGFSSYVRTTSTLLSEPAAGGRPVTVTSYQLLHRTGQLTVAVVEGYPPPQAQRLQRQLRATVETAPTLDNGVVMPSADGAEWRVQRVQPDGTLVTVTGRDLDRQIVLAAAASIHRR
jgi:hypothetical protein